MDLFNQNTIQNVLPFDGEANYHGKIFNNKQSKFYFDRLMGEIEWKNDEAIVFGKHYVTARKVAWYGDANYSYTYSNITKTANLWTKELRELKNIVENVTEETYNSCLLNLYHNGNEGMSWHSDGEKTLKENGAIASVSFGAERKFSFKHKQNKNRIDVVLENGSLLLMRGLIQKNWLHRLPPTKKVNSARINLTFRTLIL